MKNFGFLGSQTMGQGQDYSPSMKGWIATAIGAGLGLATSLIGGSQASKAAKRAERRQREREAQENAYYTRRYNEDYIDTAAGQNLVRRAKEYAKENWRRAAGAQAVAGGTDAATAQAKEAGNKMVGETIANIAATDQARKAQIDAQHQAQQANFANMDMQRELQRAQNITNAASQASNAMLQVGSALENTTDLIGGSNKGIAKASGVVQPTGGSTKLDEWWVNPHV